MFLSPDMSLFKLLKAALPTPAGPSGPYNINSRALKPQSHQNSQSSIRTRPNNSKAADHENENYNGQSVLSAQTSAAKVPPPPSVKATAVPVTSSSPISSLDFDKLSLAMTGRPTPPQPPRGPKSGTLGLVGRKVAEVRVQGKLGAFSGNKSGVSGYSIQGHGSQPYYLQQGARNTSKLQFQETGALPYSDSDAGPLSRVASSFSASASGSTTSAADFSRKRSTKTVSKINFSRSLKPNVGKRSNEAELASIELLALPPLTNADRLSSFRDSLDIWSKEIAGVDDFTFLLKEVGGGRGSGGGESEKVLAVFDWLADNHSRVKGASEWGKLASTAISVLGRLGNVRAARKVFDRARENGMGSNVFAYSSLISAYGKCGRCSEALEMLESMKSEGCRPNLITFNALIDACSKGGMPGRARTLFQEMQGARLQPDKITYNSLMGAYARAGQWQEAERVFEAMGKSGLSQDLHSYNTLLDAYCKGGQMSLAEHLLDGMSEAGIQPNMITYSSIIDGYAKAGQESSALSAYAKMQEMMKCNPGVHPDSVCYNTLLDMYGKAGRIEEALAIRTEMEAVGLGTDLVSFNALIDMMGKSNKPKEAARLFEQMQRQGHRPNVLTWSALIGAFARAGCHLEAMRYFQQFKKAGLQADVVLYSLLIDVHGKNGLVHEAMCLLKEMVANGIPPNVVTYNSLIDAYGRMGQVESAVTTMEEMKQRGVSPNAVTFNCVIDAFGKEGRADEALAMLHQMKAAGQSPDSFTFSALIDANGKRGDAWAAVQIFRDMQEWGVKPNVVTFSAVLNVCRWLPCREDAAALLAEAQRSNAQIYGAARGLLIGEGSQPGFWGRVEDVFDFVDREDSDRDRSTGMAFYNSLTDLLWHFGQRYGSYRVLLAARSRQVYKNPSWMSEMDGGLDLHQMSVGAALTMLHSWLLDLQAMSREGRALPKLLSVLTGWGRHSKVQGESSVKREVGNRLTELGSPFSGSKTNEGRIIANGALVREWLMAKNIDRVLVLRDNDMIRQVAMVQ